MCSIGVRRWCCCGKEREGDDERLFSTDYLKKKKRKERREESSGRPTRSFDEQLFVCAMLRDVASAAQAIITSLSPSMPPFAAAESTASAKSALAGGSHTAVRSNPPAGTTAAETTSTGAAPVQSMKATVTTTLGVYASPQTDESFARRRLSHSKQLVKSRRSEKRFLIHLQQCEQRHPSRLFFAQSAKEGLDAARSMLADACALLQYYYDVLASWGEKDDTAPAAAASSRTLNATPLLAARVEEAMHHPQLRRRAHASQHRLASLLLGDDAEAMMAAFAMRHLPAASAGHHPVQGTPDIALVAESMICFSAPASYRTLDSRIPMALQRILAKALPRLYLAVLFLTLGVEEPAVAPPMTVLQQRYGAWWHSAAAAVAKKKATAGDDDDATESPRTPAVVLPVATVGDVVMQHHDGDGVALATDDEAAARRYFRRYSYLGECFSYVALIYAEMPSMIAMASEANTLALLYAPHEKSLWALRAFIRYHLADQEEVAPSLDIAALLAEEERRCGKVCAAEPSTISSGFAQNVQHWRQTLVLLREGERGGR